MIVVINSNNDYIRKQYYFHYTITSKNDINSNRHPYDDNNDKHSNTYDNNRTTHYIYDNNNNANDNNHYDDMNKHYNNDNDNHSGN